MPDSNKLEYLKMETISPYLVTHVSAATEDINGKLPIPSNLLSSKVKAYDPFEKIT